MTPSGFGPGIVPTLHDDDVTTHWGLLRRPPAYTDISLSRRDLVTLASAAALAPVLLWMLMLITLAPLGWLTGIGFIESVSVTVLLYGLLLAVGFLAPVSRVPEESLIAAVITFARFRGDLGGLDVVVTGVSILAGGLLAFGGLREVAAPDVSYYPPLVALVPMIVLLAGSVFCVFNLRRMRTLGVVPRGRTVHINDWLRRLLEEQPGLEPGDSTVAPEPDAAFEYAFPVSDESGPQVGVAVPDGVLHELRSLNAEHGGRLYQQDDYAMTVTVVRGVKPPVDGVGADELKRLATQLCRIAVSHDWTPMRFANEILRFVQWHFEYVHDDESTERLLGQAYREYGRFPLETLVDGEGDCECTSLLCAALLSYVGLPCKVIVVTLHEGGESTGHVAVGLEADPYLFPVPATLEKLDGFLVHDGDVILFGETTAYGDETHGFGAIPRSWRAGMVMDHMVGIPTTG